MILQHYFFTNLLRTLIFSSIVITVLMQLTDLFIVLLPKLDDGISIKSIFIASGLNLLNAFIRSLQFALLFSNAYVVGKFSSDKELLASNSLGISLMRLARPSIYIGIACTLLSSISSDRINILQKERNALITVDKKKKLEDLPYEAFWQNGYFFSTYYNSRQKRFLDVTILETTDDGKMIRRIDAEFGLVSNKYFRLYNARIFHFTKSSEFHREYTYTKQVIKPVMISEDSYNLEDLTKQEIRDYVAKLKAEDKTTYKVEIILYERYIEPFMNLVISVFPIFFIQTKKSALLFSIIQATVLGVSLFVLQIIFSVLGNAGVIPPFLTNLAPLIVSLVILLIADRVMSIAKYGTRNSARNYQKHGKGAKKRYLLFDD